MEEIKIKKFNINEVDEITLPSVEEAKKLSRSILACGDWWWLRSPGYYQVDAATVTYVGDVHEFGDGVSIDFLAIRPIFRLNNLNSKIGDKILINRTWCTVIDNNLLLADYPVCKHKFDSESNDWETSEIKRFIESDEFKAMI